MQFTTIDVDNDLSSGGNCAVGDKFGGWWLKYLLPWNKLRF
jgi:hypothetical protein